jgi:hypothetical protein
MDGGLVPSYGNYIAFTNLQSSDPGRRGKLEAPPQHHQVDAGWGQRNNSESSLTKTADFSPSTNGSEERRLHPSWEAKKNKKRSKVLAYYPHRGKRSSSNVIYQRCSQSK